MKTRPLAAELLVCTRPKTCSQARPRLGLFGADQNNQALEPDSGGTMLAEVDIMNPSQFLFKMIGGDPNDPGLQFKALRHSC